MRRFLLRSLACGLFCLIVYCCGVVVTERWGPGFARRNLPFPERGNGMLYSRIRDVRAAGPVDVLVLGSSHAYRGYDPRIFAEGGLTLFNLGSSNQSPLQTEVLVGRYLDQLAPALVIFDVYPWVFSVDGLESTLDLLANDDCLRGAPALVLRQGNVKATNALILAAQRKWSGAYARLTADTARAADHYVPGGFVEREPAYYGGGTDGLDRYLAWNDAQFLAFGRILHRLRKRGVGVVLVQSPVTGVQAAAYENLAGFNRRMRATGLRYLDWHATLPLDDRAHFFDSHHLNQAGVELFNRALLEVLDEAP